MPVTQLSIVKLLLQLLYHDGIEDDRNNKRIKRSRK